MRPRRGQGPTTRGLAFRPLPFRGQSFGERRRRPIERVSVAFFFAQSTVLEFFAMLISRPILRYEYYQIYCVLAALFSRFAFLSSEHSLLRISVSPCVSPATLARRRVSMCLSSHVVPERRSSSSLSSSASAIILALCKRRREESPSFHYCSSTQDERRATRVDLARRPISRSVEDGGSRCVVAVQGRG